MQYSILTLKVHLWIVLITRFFNSQSIFINHSQEHSFVFPKFCKFGTETTFKYRKIWITRLFFRLVDEYRPRNFHVMLKKYYGSTNQEGYTVKVVTRLLQSTLFIPFKLSLLLTLEVFSLDGSTLLKF